MTTPLALSLASFVADFNTLDVPGHVIENAKHRVLDTVGISLAAMPLQTSRGSLRLVSKWGGAPEATAFGSMEKVPAHSAAFCNGTLAHSLDFDDTHLPSVLHPSATVVPTLLAIGETVGATGRDALAAAALSYEVCIRTGMAAYDREMGNSVFFERGWHATSICGALASAALACRLLGGDAATVANAIGIAASFASGIIEANRTGGAVKRVHCGWAAHAGIVAAEAAMEGITGPPTVFEGRFGFYQAFCGGQFRPAELIQNLGERWAIEDVFYKPYPANHFTHGAIDAALRVRTYVAVERIADIELGVASPTLRTIAEPAETKARPESGYQAQFSGPFVVAAALLGGGGLGLSLRDFSDSNVANPTVRRLAAKVRCVADPACDALFPNQFPAVLRVTTDDGRVYEERIMANRGGPANPLSDSELLVKFYANTDECLTRSDARNVAELIMGMDQRPVQDLTAYLRKVTAPTPNREALTTGDSYV